MHANLSSSSSSSSCECRSKERYPSQTPLSTFDPDFSACLSQEYFEGGIMISVWSTAWPPVRRIRQRHVVGKVGWLHENDIHLSSLNLAIRWNGEGRHTSARQSYTDFNLTTKEMIKWQMHGGLVEWIEFKGVARMGSRIWGWETWRNWVLGLSRCSDISTYQVTGVLYLVYQEFCIFSI